MLRADLTMVREGRPRDGSAVNPRPRLAARSARGWSRDPAPRRSRRTIVHPACAGTGARGSGVPSLLAGALHGVTPSDPASIAGVALVIGATAVLGALLPGLRAARAQPVTALKAE
jgi:hypothetical protein